MKKQLWLASFACALSVAAALSWPLIAQEASSTSQSDKSSTIIVFDQHAPNGIDAAGTVVGQSCCGNTVEGYYRLADGTIHNFHVPGAEHPHDYTFPYAINPAGTIIGSYSIGTTVQGGFMRDRAGNFTEFNPFGSIDTIPSAISSAGIVAGQYEDPTTFAYRAFVRDAEGNFTSFDSPGSGGVFMTISTSINSSGAIVGYAISASNGPNLGFLRESDGTLTGARS
jgi:hypothetical protein